MDHCACLVAAFGPGPFVVRPGIRVCNVVDLNSHPVADGSNGPVAVVVVPLVADVVAAAVVAVVVVRHL